MIFPWDKNKAIDTAVRKARERLVTIKFDTGQGAAGEFRLLAIIRYFPERLETEKGIVELALNGFRVRLKPENGTIVEDSVHQDLDTLLPLTTRVAATRSDQTKTSLEKSVSGRGGAGFSGMKPELKLGGEGKALSRNEDELGANDKIDFPHEIIKANASPDELTLLISAPGGVSKAMIGRIWNDALCSVEPTNPEAEVKITCKIEVGRKNVEKVDGTGIFSDTGSENKNGVISLLVTKLVEEDWYLEPHIVDFSGEDE